MSAQVTSSNDKDPFGLRPIWEGLMDLYTVFSRYCEVNGLRHYAAFGTALGAVRHGGFIPWDDDIDVYMPRPDYERLYILCATDKACPIRAVNIWTDNKHTLMFGKAYFTKESRVPIAEASDSIFIDIFPLDGLPTNKFCFLIWILERAIRRRLAMFCPIQSWRRRMSLSLEQWGKKWPYDKSYYVQCYQENLCKIKNRLYTRQMFGVAKWIAFDRIKIAIPSDVESYLKAEFGDYMRLPPVEQRKPTHRTIEHL